MKPTSFVTFVTKTLGVRLTRAQRVLAAVAVDGVDPADLTGADRDVALKLFGTLDRIPAQARAVAVLVCGRGSGKSYLFGGAYPLWRMLTATLDALAPGEMAFAPVVAPDMRTARQTLRFAIGAAKSVKSIARLIVAETSDSLVLQRPDGRVVAMEVFAASRGGSSIRGRSLVCAVLEECAFFRDENKIVNDQDIFGALAPRVMPGGMIVLVSTPWGDTGLLADEFHKNYSAPTTAVAALAPTLLMREGDEATAAMVARERARDEENALREFFCNFLAGEQMALPREDVFPWFEPRLEHFLIREPFVIIDPAEKNDCFSFGVMQWCDPDPAPHYKRAIPPASSGLSPDIFIGWERDDHGQPIELPRASRPVLWVRHLDGFEGPQIRELGMDRITAHIADVARAHGARQIVGDDRGGGYLDGYFAKTNRPHSNQLRVEYRSVPYGNLKHKGVMLLRQWARDRQIVVSPTDTPGAMKLRTQALRYRRITTPGGSFTYGEASVRDDFVCLLLTHAIACIRESEEHLREPTLADGAPTRKFLGGRITVPGR